MTTKVEELVARYGEKHRRLIEDSLVWLAEWSTTPLDYDAFVADLIDHVAPEREARIIFVNDNPLAVTVGTEQEAQDLLEILRNEYTILNPLIDVAVFTWHVRSVPLYKGAPPC